MKTTNSIATSALLCLSIAGFTGTATAAGPSVKTFLADGWELQSSAKIQAGGDAISSPAYVPPDWYPAKVPSTVVGTLVDDKVYPDPFFYTPLAAPVRRRLVLRQVPQQPQIRAFRTGFHESGKHKRRTRRVCQRLPVVLEAPAKPAYHRPGIAPRRVHRRDSDLEQ